MVYRSPHDQDDAETRVCRTCEQRKPLTDFPLANAGRHRRRRCKTCVEARRQELRAADPEKFRALDKWRAIKRKYGLTEGQYLALFDRQSGRCAICRDELVDVPHIDHDHATGAVRGLLCFTCNTALGKFRDDVAVLERAISYLRGVAA